MEHQHLVYLIVEIVLFRLLFPQGPHQLGLLFIEFLAGLKNFVRAECGCTTQRGNQPGL